jgi:hypothetical protein
LSYSASVRLGFSFSVRQELGFELEVEFAEEQLRAQLPKGSPEEQQRVRVFLAERFCLRDDRRGWARVEHGVELGKQAIGEVEVESWEATGSSVSVYGDVCVLFCLEVLVVKKGMRSVRVIQGCVDFAQERRCKQ